jgi:hypothetical protein
VLSVPWWEWNALKGGEQRAAHVVELLQRLA